MRYYSNILGWLYLNTLRLKLTFSSIHQNDRKGKRRSTCSTLSKPFRKQVAIPLATYMQIYREGDIIKLKGRDTILRGIPNKCYQGKTEASTILPSRLLALLWIDWLRARFLPRELMYILDVLNTLKSWDSFLKHVKENDKKKKEAKEKGSWIQLKHQPDSARETHFVKTNGKESELLKSIPYEFMVWKV